LIHFTYNASVDMSVNHSDKDVKTMKDELFRKQLRSLLTDYHFTLEALSRLTNISLLWFNEMLEKKSTLSSLSEEQLLTLNLTIEMFRVGVPTISDDERVSTIMKILITECRLKPETFATYADVPLEKVKLFLISPEEVEIEIKYRLAVKVMFLFSLFKDCIYLT